MRQKGRYFTAIWFYVVIIKEDLNWPIQTKREIYTKLGVVELPGVFNFHGKKCPLRNIFVSLCKYGLRCSSFLLGVLLVYGFVEVYITTLSTYC